MKYVIISIRSKWAGKIKRHEKTLELRKSIPHGIQLPFQCLIYQTLSKSGNETDDLDNGLVVGEFTCDCIDTLSETNINEFSTASCVAVEDILRYKKKGHVYGWHISDLILYDKPKNLSEYGLDRAPQSWQYVEK